MTLNTLESADRFQDQLVSYESSQERERRERRGRKFRTSDLLLIGCVRVLL